MADSIISIISGQSSANPIQAGTRGKSKPAQKAATAFNVLLALFQSDGLSGKIIPGLSGKLESAGDPLSAEAGAEREKSKQLTAPGLLKKTEQRQTKTNRAAEKSLESDLSVEGGTTGTVNMIAFLNFGGKSSADNVSPNAVKEGSPALLKAMARQEGEEASSAKKSEKSGAGPGRHSRQAGPASTGQDPDPDISRQGTEGSSVRTPSEVPAEIPAEKKLDVQEGGPARVGGGKPKPEIGASDAAEKGKAAAGNADAQFAAVLKSSDRGNWLNAPDVKDARVAGKAAGGTDIARMNPAQGKAENASAADSKNDAAKIRPAEAAGIKISGAGPDVTSGGSGNPVLHLKGMGNEFEKGDAPKAEIRPPGPGFPAVGILGAAAVSNALPMGETATDAAFAQAMAEQVSGGAIELFRSSGGRVRLSLNPPELGAVDLDLIVDGKGVRLILASESGEVRSVLQANMDQLRSSLQDQGMNRLDIQVQENIQERPGFQSGGWTAHGDQGRGSMPGNGSGQFYPENSGGAAASPVRPANNAAAAGTGRGDNSNGELSIFA